MYQLVVKLDSKTFGSMICISVQIAGDGSYHLQRLMTLDHIEHQVSLAFWKLLNTAPGSGTDCFIGAVDTGTQQ